MTQFYDTLAIPFGWIMHFFYNFSNNYLLSLIILVLLVKLILIPSSISQQKGSAKQVRLQPKVNRIRQRYAGSNQQLTREMQMKIQEETQALYKREGFSPMSGGCLPMLIQFPVMIGLYGVVRNPLSMVLAIKDDLIMKAAQSLNISTATNDIYRLELKLLESLSESNMPAPLAQYSEKILALKDQFMLFGKIDLTQTPDFKNFSILWVIPAITLAIGLITSFIMFHKQKQTNPEMAKNPSMGCMTFFSPIMSVMFTFWFPAGVGLYWILSSFFTLIQTIVLNNAYSSQKVIANAMIDETVARRSREASIIKMKEIQNKTKD